MKTVLCRSNVILDSNPGYFLSHVLVDRCRPGDGIVVVLVDEDCAVSQQRHSR